MKTTTYFMVFMCCLVWLCLCHVQIQEKTLRIVVSCKSILLPSQKINFSPSFSPPPPTHTSRQLSEEVLLGNRFDKHDWDKIANISVSSPGGACLAFFVERGEHLEILFVCGCSGYEERNQMVCSSFPLPRFWCISSLKEHAVQKSCRNTGKILNIPVSTRKSGVRKRSRNSKKLQPDTNASTGKQ